MGLFNDIKNGIKNAYKKATANKKPTRNSGRSSGRAKTKIDPNKNKNSQTSNSSNNNQKAGKSNYTTSQGYQNKGGTQYKAPSTMSWNDYAKKSVSDYRKDHPKTSSAWDSYKKKADEYRKEVDSRVKANTNKKSTAPTGRSALLGSTAEDRNNASKLDNKLKDKKTAYQNKVKEQMQKDKDARAKKYAEDKKAKLEENKKKSVAEGKKNFANSTEGKNYQKWADQQAIRDIRNSLSQQGLSNEQIASYLASDTGREAMNETMKNYEDQYRDYYEKEHIKQARIKGEKDINRIETADNEVKKRIGNRARQLGATGEDVVEATKQSAKTTTEMYDKHAFTANALYNVLPSTWDVTEMGDSAYYSDEDKAKIKKSQESKAGIAGMVAGNAVQFALPSGLAVKAGSKVIKGGSALSRGAKTVGLDTAFSSPLDAMQAYRDSKDENGNVNGKQFALNMGANVLMNGVMGGALEAGGSLLAKSQVKKLIDLQTKANNGETLTLKERQDLIHLYDTVSRKASDKNSASAIAENGLKDVETPKPTEAVEDVVKAEAPVEAPAKENPKLTKREQKQYDYYSNKEKTQELNERETAEYNSLKDKLEGKEQPKPAITKDEVKEMADLKAKEKVGVASVSDKIRIAELEDKIDDFNETMYSIGDGGTINGTEVTGKNVADATGAEEGLSKNTEEVRKPSSESGSGSESDIKGNESEPSGGISGRDALSKEQSDVLAKHGITNRTIVDTSENPNHFVDSLQNNAKTQKYGVSVDTEYTVKVEDGEAKLYDPWGDEIKGAKLYSTSSGDVTIGVKSDGDIFGFAKKKGSDADVDEAMFTALANGGNKLDAYGYVLANKYQRYGMIPVARVPYDEAVIREFNAPDVAEQKIAIFNEMKENGNQPDVYVFMHNGDDLDTVIKNCKENSYKMLSDEELGNLPEMEYDDALKYRDDLMDGKIAETEKPKEPKAESNSTKEPPKDEVKPNDDGIETTSLKDTPEYKKFQEKKKYHSENLDMKVEFADRYGVDVRERLGEFNDLGDEIASNKAKYKNSKNEAHKEDYLSKIDELETRQTEIARSIYQDVSEARLKEMRENPSSIDKEILDGKKEWSEKDMDDITAEDVRTAFTDAGGVDSLVKKINKAINSGDFGNLKGSLKAEADKRAKAEVAENLDGAIETFIKSDFNGDAQVQASRYDAIASELAKKIEADPNDTKAISDLLKITDHLTDNAVVDGKVMSAVLDVTKATPKGRVAVAQRTIDRINAKVSQRIGKTFELTDEEKIALATTPKGEELDNVYNAIAYRVYDNIPATAVEKVNEIRHLFMLGNIRTHGRNITGNAVFKGVRWFADGIETNLQHVFKSSIEKRGGTITKSRVTSEEIKKNNDFLKGEFKETYSASGGSNKFNETMRPDGVTANKGAMGWLVDKNYKALEKEDMWFFEPAFKKGYMKFVKSKEWDINNLTPAQRTEAREFALNEAEYATFRDSCAFSTWLTGKKEFLAQAKGKSALGTTGYRIANMALDSVIPFVKTPVNVFRRSIDFSPLSLGRGLIELGSKNPDTFMEGIKHISTGLTGTGIFGLGYFLANTEMISLNVGNGQHSGDDYYDRELGYQDYSLVINVGGVHKSMTIDWMSPIQTSLFMGAVAHQSMTNMIENAKEGSPLAELGDDAIAGLYAMTTPALDASFMSSTKDLIDKFSRKVEQNSGEEGKSVSSALAEVLLADMPKNYVSSLVPQIVSQTSQLIDSTQRSTKSTKEGLGGAIEGGALQIINKTPFRVMLTPKVDRMGNKVVNEDNFGVRAFNALINPSNVKDITENKYDRELIKIRNSIEDKSSKDYKLFFANFTGNPHYDLGEEGRMSRKQAYKYAKESRSYQWEMVKEMVDSERYEKYMTDDMKVQEVGDAYWRGQLAGDRTISDNYALKKFLDDKNKKQKDGEATETEVFRQLKKIKGSGADTTKLFLDFQMAENKLYTQSHSSGSQDSYYRKALVANMLNAPEMIEAYGIYDDKAEAMDKYWKAMKKEYGKDAKSKAMDEVTMFGCGITASLEKANFYKNSSKTAQCIGAGMMFMNNDKQPERVYRAFGYNWNEAQGGAGLCKYNTDGRYDYDNLESMKAEITANSKANGNKGMTKAETVAYVQNKLDSGEIEQDEARCLYVALYGGAYANPFGDVDDHLEWGTEPDDLGGGKGGYGRRGGRRGRRGHGGGGHGGGSGSGNDDWYKFAGDIFTDLKSTKKPSVSKASDFTKASPLNNAYRKRVRKLNN